MPIALTETYPLPAGGKEAVRQLSFLRSRCQYFGLIGNACMPAIDDRFVKAP